MISFIASYVGIKVKFAPEKVHEEICIYGGYLTLIKLFDANFLCFTSLLAWYHSLFSNKLNPS